MNGIVLISLCLSAGLELDRDVLYTGLSPPHLSEKPRNVQKEAKLSGVCSSSSAGAGRGDRNECNHPQIMSKGCKLLRTNLCFDIVDFR